MILVRTWEKPRVLPGRRKECPVRSVGPSAMIAGMPDRPPQAPVFRGVVALIHALGVLAAPLTAEAQPARKVSRLVRGRIMRRMRHGIADAFSWRTGVSGL